MGRILAIDFGKKRIGLAVSDSLQMISSPLDVYQNDSGFIGRLKKLHDEYKFEKVVMGLPVSEEYPESAERVRRFAKVVEEGLGLPIVFQDEAFSTVYAAGNLKSARTFGKKYKSKIDKYAAAKILEDYLRQESE